MDIHRSNVRHENLKIDESKSIILIKKYHKKDKKENRVITFGPVSSKIAGLERLLIIKEKRRLTTRSNYTVPDKSLFRKLKILPLLNFRLRKRQLMGSNLQNINNNSGRQAKASPSRYLSPTLHRTPLPPNDP